jgi:hypothetical protein
MGPTAVFEISSENLPLTSSRILKPNKQYSTQGNWSEVKWREVNVYTIIVLNYVLRWEYFIVISLV